MVSEHAPLQQWMVRLGHAYDNLMIDMGEANEKLRERATWI